MGYREHVCVSRRLKSQCVRELCLGGKAREREAERGGGLLKTSCPCSTSSHSVFYPRFLNFHCLFRSSWLSADNAIRVSLHVHYASMFWSIVKMSMVRAPPQGQHPNEKSPGNNSNYQITKCKASQSAVIIPEPTVAKRFDCILASGLKDISSST